MKKETLLIVIALIGFCKLGSSLEAQNGTYSHPLLSLTATSNNWVLLANNGIVKKVKQYNFHNADNLFFANSNLKHSATKKRKILTDDLHVEGNGKFDGSLVVEHIVNTDWGYGLSVNINRDKTKAFTVNVAGSGANLFTIWGNGVVNAKNIYAEEVEVRVDALGIYWPDYVFRDDYKLRPLAELEQFITINSHLPEVPSEKELLEEGLNLGEMDAILLKKIEELTLYIIAQQKEIDNLKAIIENPKK